MATNEIAASTSGTGSADAGGVAGKRIWMVGINYAPDAVGIAPYTTQLAEYLHSRGAELAVTTGVPYYPDYRVAPEYRRVLARREVINGVAVRRLRHTVPHHMTAARRALHEASFFGHVMVRRPPFRPDLVIGVTPALSGATSAAVEAKRLGAPLLLVVQDLVGPGTLQSGIAGGKRMSGIAEKIERWAVRHAAGVVVLHDRFRPYALTSGTSPDQVHVVRNWSYAVRSDVSPEQARRELGWPTDRPVVLYAGNMGLKMGLENVIRAAELAEDRGDEILFVLLGGGSQRESLEKEARGISSIRFENSRYGASFAAALTAADILLINERPSMDNMSLPSKLAYYFTSGRPVLAAVAAGGTTALEVELAQAGIVVEPGSPEKLLEASLGLAADPVRRTVMGEAGRTYAAQAYDREAILSRYERIITEIVRA